MDRRTLLTYAAKGTVVTVAGAAAIPAAITSLSPVLQVDHPPEWQTVGPVTDFPIQGMIKAAIQLSKHLVGSGLEKKGVYVWRKSEDDFVVYSRACTDLGCPVNWDPGSEWFFCPCHGGIFDKEGERKAGPPRRALWRYETRVHEGNLQVNLRSVPPMV